MVGDSEKPSLPINFNETEIKVKIIPLETPTEFLYMQLSELKQKFYKQREHCKMDWQFIYWDLKLKKYKQQYSENKSITLYNTIKKFIDNIKLEFYTDRKTFDIALKYFTKNCYPFGLKSDKKEKLH